MVDSIASTTSLIGHRPLSGGGPCSKDVSSSRRRSDGCQRLLSFPHSRPRSRRSSGGFCLFTVKSLAMEVTKEANWSREGNKVPPNLGYSVGVGLDSNGLWPPPNKADNPALHNPLRRLERMGCGWLGVIFEWEGVIVEDDANLEKQSWLMLAQEEGKSPPPTFILRRIEGMKNEQAISEVLC